jgi:hypothetical protein
VSGSKQPAYDTVEYHNQGLQDLLLSGNTLTPRDPIHPPGSLRDILFPGEQQTLLPHHNSNSAQALSRSSRNTALPLCRWEYVYMAITTRHHA